ncbi:MAG TPA: hypothetical protein VMF11_15045 [Candidatus Baltobacteraceae bacterium]|nr:hypothetical protein [Candidatus Baltobacteraceae bacterium]
MNSYTEFLEKAQTEFLNGLKQAQDVNVKAIASINELIEQNGPAKLPTPAELISQTFAFTNQVLESRKEYLLKLTELLPKN